MKKTGWVNELQNIVSKKTILINFEYQEVAEYKKTKMQKGESRSTKNELIKEKMKEDGDQRRQTKNKNEEL